MEHRRHEKRAPGIKGVFLDDSRRDLHLDFLQLVCELATYALTDRARSNEQFEQIGQVKL